MKALVTGSAGFIGSHLVDKLIKGGHEVVGIDDLSGGYLENVNPDSTFYKLDCRDFAGLDVIFQEEEPELVYHLAANASENKAQFSPVDITSRNYDAFIKVLTAGLRHGIKKIIVTSSTAVYGAIQTPYKESARPKPEDLYGISKLAMEDTLKVMSKVHNFGWVITRPHNVYGPQQNMSDPYRNVVTIFMNAVLNKKPYHIYGDGEQVRCFSYIDPVVKALYKCGFEEKAEGKIFNIGSDIAFTVNDLSRAIQEVTGTYFAPTYLPERPQEVKIVVSDHKLAKEMLGYNDNISLEDGLRKTWEWARSKGPQKAELGEIEIESDKLPKSWQKR